MTKFINRLRKEIKREVNLPSAKTLAEAYHKVLEVERYLRTPNESCMTFQAKKFYHSWVLSHNTIRNNMRATSGVKTSQFSPCGSNN